MNLHRRKVLHLALAAAALASRPAVAQAWPSRPIRLLVGFPPGGATDIIARLYGQALSQRLGQPVVIENRPGSGGNMASDAAAKAAPDGYTLLHGTDNVFMSNPHIYGRMPFDPFKDLVPVASLSSNQLVLAVHARRREIGLLRVLGMTADQIRKMLLLEGAFVGLLGGTLAVLLGVPLGFGSLAALKLVSAFEVEFELPIHYALLTIAGAVAVALMAALYPARQAASARSAESVHYE